MQTYRRNSGSTHESGAVYSSKDRFEENVDSENAVGEDGALWTV